MNPDGSPQPFLDRAHLEGLIRSEVEVFRRRTPSSAEAFESARSHLVAGVPMPWMGRWAGGYPVFLAEARGNHLTDLDGNEYVDFSLGDTAAMAGHSPAPTIAAVVERISQRGGIAAMLPTEDAAAVSAELAVRFGLPLWQFTLSATDANRFAIRIARQIQSRPFLAIFNWSYHGSVDETIATADISGRVVPKPGNVGPPIDPAATTRVMEFNDLDSVRRALAPGDVAAVLAEPALTNVGIVLPDEGFLAGLERACADTGTLLIYDETHTFSAGPGGATAAWGLHPDIVTIGKSFGGGVPIGAYGVSTAVADRIAADPEGDYLDWGGVGGTLAGNALSLAAARATLAEVLTPEAFETMVARATRFRHGVEDVVARHGVGWSCVQLGTRAEYMFSARPPSNGTEAHRVIDEELDTFMHLFLLNRGVMITPFHNMALMAPSTLEADVDRHTEVFDEALVRLAR